MSGYYNSPARRFYAVESGPVTRRPHFDGQRDLVANVRELADWEWGARRAAWVVELAEELTATGVVDTDRLDEWVAAILCAAAVDSGRDRRPQAWSRTLSAISGLTGVDRQEILARHRELQTARPQSRAV